MDRADAEAPAAAGEDAPPPLSERPLRWVQAHCPFLARWLDAVGYDQALIVRDWTHLCLYLSFAISLFCAATWGMDVCSGDCALPRPWLSTSIDNYRCLYELFGFIIFFGIMLDSIQMIGHYDNDHQVLLKRKQRVMDEVRVEAREALHRLEAITQELTHILVTGTEKSIHEHIKDYYGIVWPHLSSRLLPQGDEQMDEQGKEDVEMLRCLNELIGKNLNELGRLAVAYHAKLKSACQTLNTHPTGGQAQVVAPCDRRPKFWLLLLKPPLDEPCDEGSMRSSRVSVPAHGSELDHSVKKNPCEFVFAPVKEMVRFVSEILKSDHIQKVQQAASQSFYEPRTDQLFGMGSPPWDSSEEGESSAPCCMCCLPRLVAHLLRCLTCCCRRCCETPRDCLFKSIDQYPKYVKVGCFWVKLISRLHERLLHGLALTMAYCTVYGWTGWGLLSKGCPSRLEDAQFWNCIWEVVRRATILVALLFQVPALLRCLARIRDLDAILAISEDIWRIQDIRNVLKELETSVQVDSERQGLLQAIKDRVLVRINLIQQFRRQIVRLASHGDKDSLRAMTKELVELLWSIACDLKSANHWVDLPGGKQQALANMVKERVDKFGQGAPEDFVNTTAEPSEQSEGVLSTPSSFASVRRVMSVLPSMPLLSRRSSATPPGASAEPMLPPVWLGD